MELDDLRIFLAVARRGTLTEAATEVHLSQPALTRRLQKLERTLQTQLFDRSGRRLILTPAGSHFEGRAAEILAQVADLGGEMASIAAGIRGRLRVGATVTSCLYLLPPLFQRFRAEHPHIQMIVRNDTSRRMADLVYERRIDVGIASTLTPRDGVRVIPWRELDLALVRPRAAGTEWKAPTVGRPFAVPDLSGTPMVVPSAGTVRMLTDSLFARCRIAPPVVAECDSLEVVKSLVAAGFGHAVLPRACLLPDEPALEVVDVAEPLPRLPVAALVPRAGDLPAPVEAFLALLNGVRGES